MNGFEKILAGICLFLIIFGPLVGFIVVLNLDKRNQKKDEPK